MCFWNWMRAGVAGWGLRLEQHVLMPLLGMSASAQSAWVAQTLRRRGRVLEVGISTGALTSAIYAQRPALQVIGVDPSFAALRQCQAELRQRGIVNVALVCADPALLPFAADQFEQIVALNVLPRVPRYQAVIDELLRVAIDGATVVGTSSVDIGAEPPGSLQRRIARWRSHAQIAPDDLHELLGLTWSRLSGQRTGAIYAFRRPALDRATGEPLPPD